MAGHPADSDRSDSTKTNENTFLLWLAKDGPKWARVPAIVAGILVAVVPGVLLLANSLNGWKETVAETPAARQLQMAASGVITARDAAIKAMLSKPDLTPDDRQKLAQEVAEMDHELGHLNNPADEVKWTTFAKRTTQDYFGWKLFPSDKCLVIARIENGAATAQWLSDPFHPSPTQRAPTTGQSTSAASVFRETSARLPTDPGIPVVYAAEADDKRGDTAGFPFAVPQFTPVQGICLNPHPGSYSESWGAFINQCQQPIFRRWADGCSHVQLYDHCYNVWGPVVWQFCAAYHHP